MSEPLAGWYPDPSGDQTKLRYWNGVQWTDDFTEAHPASAPTQNTTINGAPVTSTPVNKNDSLMKLVAFIFMIVSTVTTAWLIVPLIWMVPMTIRSWKIYKGTAKNTTVFAICSLIFVSLIAGILLLLAEKED